MHRWSCPAYRIALNLRAPRPPAHPSLKVSSCGPAHNTPLPFTAQDVPGLAAPDPVSPPRRAPPRRRQYRADTGESRGRFRSRRRTCYSRTAARDHLQGAWTSTSRIGEPAAENDSCFVRTVTPACRSLSSTSVRIWPSSSPSRSRGADQVPTDARGGNRTRMPLPAQDFESCASASSATRATLNLTIFHV